MKVQEVMTTEVITISEKHTRQQAAALMARHRISGLPVVDQDGMVLGVVSEYDVISREGKTVGDIMTRSLISVSANTDLADVRPIFVQQHIRRLPVLEQGRLVGIVSRADLVREVATRWMCRVCGEVTHSEGQPEHCSRCGSEQIESSDEPLPPGS